MIQKRFWLMKCEPSVYSIDDLKRDQTTHWSGVRNYQARNFMRDQMRKEDLALFYHSNAAPSGVSGIAMICREAYPDFTALDPKSPYYDPKSTREKPIWMMVDVQFMEKFPHFISLSELKSTKSLSRMLVLKRGTRLSIQPVDEKHFEIVKNLGAK